MRLVQKVFPVVVERRTGSEVRYPIKKTLLSEAIIPPYAICVSFIVVAGHGLIQERKIGTEDIIEFEVSGDKIQAVHMLPGYTHNIINLSDTEDLVTVMWANELFDPDHPDTFFEKV